MARDKAEALRSTSVERISLNEFIPKVSPKYQAPLHLKPIVDALEKVPTELVELAFSVPPRHHKTETILHAIAWLMLYKPDIRIAYLTYAHDQAASKSMKARRLALRAGVKLDGKQTENEWHTAAGGLLKATSVLGQLTGDGYDVIIIDDPHKNREEANSPTIRNKIVEAFKSDIYTRQDNTPTSFIVVHTRWHPGDLIGHITSDDFRGEFTEPFKYINLPAVNDNGQPLMPEHWGLDRLNAIEERVGPNNWWALFMGNPRQPGAIIFGPPALCTMADIPRHAASGFGVDLSYTKKTSSDWSIRVRMVRGNNRKFYVADVFRFQGKATKFSDHCKPQVKLFPGAPWRWRASGVEIGSADFMIREGIPVVVLSASTDKIISSEPFAAAWERGDILVPSDAHWSKDYIQELTNFTGLGGGKDDQVDASASAFEAVQTGMHGGKVDSVSLYETNDLHGGSRAQIKKLRW